MLEWIIEHPQFVSAAAALLSAALTLIIYIQTNRKLKPYERPIIYCVDLTQNARTNTLYVVFSNQGKKPASDITITMCKAPLDKPDKLKIIKTETSSQKIYPGQGDTLMVPGPSDGEYLVYFFLKYSDSLKKYRRYYDEFFFVVKYQDAPEIASIKVAESAKPFATSLIPERKKID